MKTIHFFLLFIILAVFIWSGIEPASYTDWALEVGPALIGIIILALTFKRFRLTTLSYVIITMLCILMFIGGHYTYSKVPLFNWMKDYFDLERNHYDRFGHFFKGFFIIIIREIIIRKTLIKNGGWLIIFALSISLSIAALYEIIEWLVSKMTHGGKAAKDFLGTQGDIWDAQWDMLLTLLGSIFALLILTKLHDRFMKNT
ncbi:DUF2238 domain-containing protein [Robertmurraya kyonggiensis]|uniref:DUF2238 domain-containing protein n=1 Tax=Robertmurraya kyonggiensis TaxID=1037680 RepID=UPI001FEC9400|nr:DUF2238 domain-containing protein [Robertmurraya kyonggiensis]